MSLITVRTILYRAVWTLLEASPDVVGTTQDKVRPGNKVKLTETGKDREKPVTKQFGDFPNLAVLYDGPAEVRDFLPSPRYRYSQGGSPAGILNELSQKFRVVITHASADARKNDPLVQAVFNALRAGGPGMGLVPSVFPYVVRGEMSIASAVGRVPSPVTGEPEGANDRAQTTITFTAAARWRGSPPTQTV